MKLENEKKDLIIKGLQKDYSQKGKKHKKKKVDINVKELTEQKVKNDYLALIQRLREQLKYMKEDKVTIIMLIHQKTMKLNLLNQKMKMKN